MDKTCLFQILDHLSQKGKFNNLKALDISHTHALSENAIYQFLQSHGHHLTGLMCCGKPKLTENFWLNVIGFLTSIRYMYCCHKISTSIFYVWESLKQPSEP